MDWTASKRGSGSPTICCFSTRCDVFFSILKLNLILEMHLS